MVAEPGVPLEPSPSTRLLTAVLSAGFSAGTFSGPPSTLQSGVQSSTWCASAGAGLGWKWGCSRGPCWEDSCGEPTWRCRGCWLPLQHGRSTRGLFSQPHHHCSCPWMYWGAASLPQHGSDISPSEERGSLLFISHFPQILFPSVCIQTACVVRSRGPVYLPGVDGRKPRSRICHLLSELWASQQEVGFPNSHVHAPPQTDLPS